MAFEQILTTVDQLCDLEEARRDSLQEEFESYEMGELETFDQTRAVISRERDALSTLDDLLEGEREHIDRLAEGTAHLSVDQAVRHREASIEKLSTHNQALRTFCDSLSAALDTIEVNLDQIESRSFDDVRDDPEPHLEASRNALEAHNEAVEGLRDNLTILNAYMV